MSRIDVQTLVMAFEKRIEALEKNPPDKVPTSVIISLLEKAIEDEMKNHFVFLIQKDILKKIKGEFSDMRDDFVKRVMESMLTDKGFRDDVEKLMKSKMLRGIEFK